jgi:hypothetical protein
MLTAVKQINGRRFASEIKAWQLPGSVETIRNQLEISGYQLEGGSPVADTPPPSQAGPSASSSFGSDRIRVLIQGYELAIVGGSFQQMLAAVKELPQRRFNAERKMWEIPGEAAIIKTLIETAGFQLEGADKLLRGAGPAAKPAEFERPDFGPPTPPPVYQEPDFSGDDDVPLYEAPDWWDDKSAPPPPMEPPDWWTEEEEAMPGESPGFPSEEIANFDDTPTAAKRPAAASAGNDQIRIRLGGIPLVISGGPFQEMLAVIKKIPGRRFNGEEKVWNLPADITLEGLQQRVSAAGFVVKRD